MKNQRVIHRATQWFDHWWTGNK